MRKSPISTGFALGLMLLLVTLVTSADRAAAAAAPASYSISIAHTDVDPKIDGTLDDPEWKKATHVDLGWDLQFRRPANETTDAYIMADKQYLYVAFVAQQSEPITATLHTNDVTLAADDLVRVYFWPSGENGFEYGFVSTPIGTRNEFSTENSAFAPHWTAVGKRTPTGYVVTEQIPLNVMRGDGRSTWRVQFERLVHVTSQDIVWAYDPQMRGADSNLFVGYMTDMKAGSSSTRTKPRVGLYTLGQLGSVSAGGDTSHMGADIAVPITNTASFFSTLHPDYSNVDLDQQTISPTAFARQFQEVRPFFTQGLNFYNNFNCNDCINVPFLYTPSIPTPRDGYAVEGVQGQAQFAAFDSLGIGGRNDAAQSLILQSTDRRYIFNALRFSTNGDQSNVAFANGPVHDNTSIYQLTVGNHHNFSVYETAGGETGSNTFGPINASQAKYYEYGINFYAPKSGFFPAYHDVGSQYSPTDGFNFFNDAHGPSIYVFREWDNSPTSYVKSYLLSQDIQHYRNSSGQLNLADAFSYLNIQTRNQYRIALSTGYQYVLLPNGYGANIGQNGVSLSYGNNTNAPTTVQYYASRFGPGYLYTWLRSTTLRLGARGTLTLEGDSTTNYTDANPDPAQAYWFHKKDVQWLERASVAYQLGSGSSLAVGVRRIIGYSPLLVPPCGLDRGNPGFDPRQCLYTNAANVSFAYYRHVGQDELYVVYGDPNRLTTLPAFIVKFVHYFGAEKGT